MILHCRDCRAEWTVPNATHPILPAALVQLLRGYVNAGCPQCGATGDAVLCGPAVAPEPQTPLVSTNVFTWGL